MKKLAVVLFIISSADVFALEKYLMRVPDELNPKVGAIGVKMYDSEPPAISIPLSDGKFLVVRNETHRLESKYGSSGFGVPTKVVDLDVITRYIEAARHFPSITLQVGDSTLFAYRQENHYAGPLVSMGAEYVVGVYLPEGRMLDEEVRGMLKKVTFVPIAGLGVDTALKMYGPGSRVPAGARLKTVKKMVEARGECCELIELLSTLTSDAETTEWCRGRLKLLNPGKYAPDARLEIKEYNSDDDAQRKAVMEMLSASRRADKAFANVPAGDDDGAAAVTANKTKTITLPGGVKMEFVWCAKGVFTMGQNDREWEPSKKEEPRRKITLTKGFWLAKYETTQGQWKSVMGANPSNFTGDDNLPVETVSWKMCKDFIRKAETDAGVKLRLPTEAEWEYACRAGTRTAYHWGYQPNTKKANYNGEDKFHPERSLPTVGKTVKVGSYAPNAWGFHDMLGNVAEWCEDDWLDEPPTGDAQDPLHVKEGGTLKIRRGGNWDSPGFACRAADRDWFGQGRKSNAVGVRFVLEETSDKTVAPQPKPAPQPVEVAPQPKPAPQPVEIAPQPKPAPQPVEIAPQPKPAPQPVEIAPQPTAVVAQGRVRTPAAPPPVAVPNKTKTITLPGGATMEMIYCPPGTYMMGSREDSPGKESHDVCPQIKVTLTKGFWLGKYEVTQAQWKSVMGANPSDPESSGDDLPVNNMSWDDAASFAKKVGGGARLPTDAEWEYACKAGTDTVFHWGDTCNGTEANCNGKKPFGTDKKGPNIDHAVKVGSYAPNAWGFHDMAGNVAEWCSDRHKDYYITHPKELTDPKGGDSSVRYRTVRGGCFYSYWRAVDCRSVKRDLCPPDVTRAYVGFRLAMDDDGEGTVAAPGRAVVPRPPQGNVAPNKTKTKSVTLPGGATMEMVWCPPGTFMMGTPASEADRESKETLHKVTLTKGFWLGKYEVTQAQWRSVMGANPSKNVGDDLPVENVSWEMCDEFCRKVGGKARFPTEAEWEYACRAGTTTAFYWGGALNGDKANCEGDHPYGTDVKGPSAGHTTKGGTYGENPWGLCDMSGNVEEWCYDWYDLLKADDAVDPKIEEKGHFRIVRGGYWRGFATWCRSGRRGYGHPTAADDRRGFRLAMDE